MSHYDTENSQRFTVLGSRLLSIVTLTGVVIIPIKLLLQMSWATIERISTGVVGSCPGDELVWLGEANADKLLINLLLLVVFGV